MVRADFVAGRNGIIRPFNQQEGYFFVNDLEIFFMMRQFPDGKLAKGQGFGGKG
jgi:hypothetical protein